MSAPASRPVHPCLLSVFDGNAGAEHATWAHMTTTNMNQLPNLVTAQGSALHVYAVDDATGKLIRTHMFTDLAGSVCFLAPLKTTRGSDSLLVGFSGHPRLAIVSLTRPEGSLTSHPTLLMATTLIDLTQALTEHSMGSVTPLEQDLVASLEQKTSNVASLAVVLGGGVAVATLTLRYVSGKQVDGWQASEPYILPLASMPNRSKTSTEDKSKSAAQSAATQQSVAHGFGDILSACFLTGYLEPTLVLLHSHSEPGRAWPGRLGRPDGEGGTRYGLTATAISITISHRRSAVLWSVEVPADAQSLHSVGITGCLVVSVNSVLEISNSGRIATGGMLAVNGWARVACPAGLLDRLCPNPSPLPKLAIQLDGAQLAFVRENAAIVSLRRGQLYLLQQIASTWSLISVGHTLGAVGQVSGLLALPFPELSKRLWVSLMQDKDKNAPSLPQTLSMGLVFAGSRLGDSSLLGYSIETGITLFDGESLEASNGKKPKVDDVGSSATLVKVDGEQHFPRVSNEYEIVLQTEEEALYAPEETEAVETYDDETLPDVIPPSEDEEDEAPTAVESNLQVTSKKRRRARLTNMTMIRSLVAVDSLTAPGPIGLGCEGPLSRPSLLGPSGSSSSWDDAPVLGGSAQVFPCGLGSSGGLALLTVPGRDDRLIASEADCLNMQCLINLPQHGVLLMARTKGTTVLRTRRESNNPSVGATGVESELTEVDIADWCRTGGGSDYPLESAVSVLSDMTLLSAAELDSECIVAVVQMNVDTQSAEMVHAVVLLREKEGKLTTDGHYQLIEQVNCSIVSVTPMLVIDQKGGNSVSFGCVWSSGNATVTTVGSKKASFKTSLITCTSTEVDAMDENEEAEDEAAFYGSDRITAMDLFMGPDEIFSKEYKSKSQEVSVSAGETEDSDSAFSDEDVELYRDAANSCGVNESSQGSDQATEQKETKAYVAVCRQSGALQLFELSDFKEKSRSKTKSPQPICEVEGCGLGSATLDLKRTDSIASRYPRMHKVHGLEIRFFLVGSCVSDGAFDPGRKLCLAVETNTGDFHLYERHRSDDGCLIRMPLCLASRSSLEQARHKAKLRRKGIIGGKSLDETLFRHNNLHAFSGISGQDGLFAGLARPRWIVSHRGSVVALAHRSRHCAAAGGRPRPVTGFCLGPAQTGKSTEEKSFLTLHERIGRVGSQRVTLFRGITDVFSNNGFFPGGGLCFEKISLGVTVHSIQLVNDTSVSSGEHPLYAMLISRELESDQSNLNDDGLSHEERQRISELKETELVKRQVEADLGGFDLEQEWVEEIERENCFEVDLTLGGAPPVYSRLYALWIVDAADNWNVVDSFQLDEYEHGMTLQVMSLTEVNEEPGSNTIIPEDSLSDSLFIAVGTGIVDSDGEDVGSKGRVLLFTVKRHRQVPNIPVTVELNLVYEKDILHGPVTSLTCLSCDGRKRLIIGAGADVNVEQWGNDKLTQVGFFRANMQVLDIMMFKTFLILSDSYDSLYFLVWRESDKSLTLLAKDYEPIPVYAAGLLSRGGSMSFVCHDDRQNLQFFQYAPGDAAARGGNKLVCRADIHAGAQTVAFQNHSCRSSLLINSATPTSTLEALKQQDTFFGKAEDDQRLAVQFGTTDGGLSSIVPLSEPVYWRLTALQSVMSNALESDCSLSQRAWRLYRRTPRRGGCRSHERKKGVIDGDLVMQYADLSLMDQEDLASAIGSTVDLILDNLLELECASMVL